METVKRPLEGVKVVELATMVAAPAAGRFLADMGAEVIKIESAKGDMLRYGAHNEGRPLDPLENMTFDLENANKKGIAIDLRDEKGKEVFFKLIDTADVFLTNWRPQALARKGISYEDLKSRYPGLVYAGFTGYGEKGPDCALPGFDATAFFARGGWSGTLYQKGTVPPNWTPGLGDHQAAMVFAAGILAALFRAKITGVGDKVSVNLLHTSIYMQGLMLQTSQYKDEFDGLAYPMDRSMNANPLFSAAKTKDDRFIQIMCVVYDAQFETIMKAIDREDLIGDAVLSHLGEIQKAGRIEEMYVIFQEAIAKKTAQEWKRIFSEADVAFSICQTWDEVLADEQAWAIDCFCKMDYPRGEKAVVRIPVDLEDTPLPPYQKGPLIGEHSREILEGLGYSDSDIDVLLADEIITENKR